MPTYAEPALLLDALLLDRAGVREDPLLHPDQVDGAELEALRVVQRHQRHERRLAADRVLVGVERDLLQERRERRLGVLLLPLARERDELLQVLDAPLRLDRPLGLERLDRARTARAPARSARAPRAPARPTSATGSPSGTRRAPSAARCRRRPARRGHRLPQRDLRLVGERHQPRERRVADPRRGRFAIRSSDRASYGLSITWR